HGAVSSSAFLCDLRGPSRSTVPAVEATQSASIRPDPLTYLLKQSSISLYVNQNGLPVRRPRRPCPPPCRRAAPCSAAVGGGARSGERLPDLHGGDRLLVASGPAELLRPPARRRDALRARCRWTVSGGVRRCGRRRARDRTYHRLGAG